MLGSLRRREASEIGYDAVNSLIAFLNVLHRIGRIGIPWIVGSRAASCSAVPMKFSGLPISCSSPAAIVPRALSLAFCTSAASVSRKLLQAVLQLAVGSLQIALELSGSNEIGDARAHLKSAERLDQKIVGAVLERDDLCLFVGPRRQHDDLDGPRFGFFLERAAHFKTADARKHDVEQDEIGPGLNGLLESGYAVFRFYYPIAFAQHCHEIPPHIRLIVDDEQERQMGAVVIEGERFDKLLRRHGLLCRDCARRGLAVERTKRIVRQTIRFFFATSHI